MCALEHTFLVTPLIVRGSLASALVTDSRHHRHFEGQMTSLGFGLENTDLNSKQTQNICPHSILLLGISESGLILIHISYTKTKKVSLPVSHLRIYYLLIFNYHSRHWRTVWYFIASCASIHSAPFLFLHPHAIPLLKDLFLFPVRDVLLPSPASSFWISLYMFLFSILVHLEMRIIMFFSCIRWERNTESTQTPLVFYVLISRYITVRVTDQMAQRPRIEQTQLMKNKCECNDA